jgi:hypothetical protein
MSRPEEPQRQIFGALSPRPERRAWDSGRTAHARIQRGSLSGQRRRKPGDISNGNQNPELVCHLPKLCGHCSVFNVVRETQESVDVI